MSGYLHRRISGLVENFRVGETRQYYCYLRVVFNTSPICNYGIVYKYLSSCSSVSNRSGCVYLIKFDWLGSSVVLRIGSRDIPVSIKSLSWLRLLYWCWLKSSTSLEISQIFPLDPNRCMLQNLTLNYKYLWTSEYGFDLFLTIFEHIRYFFTRRPTHTHRSPTSHLFLS